MKSLVIFIVFTFICTINALALKKRVVTTETQQCVDKLKDISTALTEYTHGLYSNIGSGFPGINDFHNTDAFGLYVAMKISADVCCVVPSPVSGEDSSAILSEVGILTSKYEETFTSLREEKPQIYLITGAPDLIKSDISSFDESTSKLNTCLLSVTSANELKTMQEYTDRIKSSLVETDSTFEIIR